MNDSLNESEKECQFQWTFQRQFEPFMTFQQMTTKYLLSTSVIISFKFQMKN